MSFTNVAELVGLLELVVLALWLQWLRRIVLPGLNEIEQQRRVGQALQQSAIEISNRPQPCSEYRLVAYRITQFNKLRH